MTQAPRPWAKVTSLTSSPISRSSIGLRCSTISPKSTTRGSSSVFLAKASNCLVSPVARSAAWSTCSRSWRGPSPGGNSARARLV